MNISIHKKIPDLWYYTKGNYYLQSNHHINLTFKVLLKLILMVKLAKKQVDILISINHLLQILYHVVIIIIKLWNLFNQLYKGFISCHIMSLVINSLGGIHTCTSTHTLMLTHTHIINFKKPGALVSATWFK